MKWFRFYSEFRADTKIKRLPIAHRYAFVILLCLANEDEERGCITKLDDEDIAFELEMELEDWQTLKSKFRAKGFVEHIEGGIKISSWDKRQFSSDSSAERVKKYRRKKAKRDCNVTEALAKRDVTPSDTDTDTDPEKIVDPIHTACPKSGTKVAREKNPQDESVMSSLKQGTTAQVLARIPESSAEVFEKFWQDYCKFCKSAGKNSGSKKPAAVRWVELVKGGFRGRNLDDFRRAYRIFKKRHSADPSGIPHAERFIFSVQRSSGLWEDILEQEEASRAKSGFVDDSLPTNPAYREWVPPARPKQEEILTYAQVKKMMEARKSA